MKILAVGGGSGGHVTPVLTVVNELVKLDPTLDVLFVCDEAFESQSKGIMSHADVAVVIKTITAGKLRRYSHLSFLQHFTVPGVVRNNLWDGLKTTVGIVQSLWILLRFRPAIVFAKGGYVCLPMGFAAHLLRIPLVLHDSDTRPGLTNRMLARYAKAIATGSPLENYPYRTLISQYVGVPIADAFRPVDETERQKLQQKLGFSGTRPLLVVTGGGLGAKSINQAASAAQAQFEAAEIDVYHITGKAHVGTVEAVITPSDHYRVISFVYEHMDEVLRAADVVVTRGSATFIQELAGIGVASIIVPAHQLGDQIKNAVTYQSANAAIVLTDDEITNGRLFVDAVLLLTSDRSKRQEYAHRLHGFAKPDAARAVAQIIMNTAKQL